MFTAYLNNKVSLFGFIQIIALATGIFSIGTIFDYWHRYLELFVHFKIQYFISSLVCFCIFLVFKKYLFSLLMALLVVLNLNYILPWYVGLNPVVSHVDSKDGLQLKIIHSNVKTDNRHYQDLIQLVLKESPDILIAQEVSDVWVKNLKSLANNYPYSKAIPRNDNFGIAIYSRYPFDKLADIYSGTWHIPTLTASFTVAGQSFSLISTHTLPPLNNAYAKSRNAQLKMVAQLAKGMHKPLILIGDLNITMWSSDYQALETQTQLVNARKGFGLLPTWPARAGIFMIPIDQCLVSSDIVVNDIRVGEDIGSDHLPLIVSLQL